jgi:hypothetical protein
MTDPKQKAREWFAEKPARGLLGKEQIFAAGWNGALSPLTNLLTRIQWVTNNDGGFEFCPCCYAAKPIHERDCELKVTLQRLRGIKG